MPIAQRSFGSWDHRLHDAKSISRARANNQQAGSAARSRVSSSLLCAVACQVVCFAMASPHTVKVMTLYRRSLKCMMNWAIDSKVISKEHIRIRKLFEKNRHGDGPALLIQGEKTLKEYTHPDPHISAAPKQNPSVAFERRPEH